MIRLNPEGGYLQAGALLESIALIDDEHRKARTGTMTYKILRAHQTNENMEHLSLKFDALASHDITYVGIIQTARASGMKAFPVPYVLTNCHNSLAAVGGTINEDDHLFAHTAARRYGGIYVPPHLAVIHQYMRETMASVGHMILGSDSHTRYGALGTMAIGEGGGELAKQLMQRTYDMPYPKVVGVYLKGAPKQGVGPQDVALLLVKSVFSNGFVTNKVLEFIGPGVDGLSVEYRNGIDVMTTETTCLSSIWKTDSKVEQYYAIHGRKEAYYKLEPDDIAYYDGIIEVDLSEIEPMIALPFHPSHVYRLRDLIDFPRDILKVAEGEAVHMTGLKPSDLNWQQYIQKNAQGKEAIYVQQGIIAGCAGGTYENISAAETYLRDQSTGNGFFSLSIYPSSQPTQIALVNQGIASSLMQSGAIWRTAFCGPCFGAGDVPNHKGLSVRHTTRNFPNREGAIPKDGQMAAVALMDARSIAATAANGGQLTSALNLTNKPPLGTYTFDDSVYKNRVYSGYHAADQTIEVIEGPNIEPWPEMSPLPEHLILSVASVLTDPITTTDELIPSGETSSYRSNPSRLAQYTLSRKDPNYVGRTSATKQLETLRQLVKRGEKDISALWNEVSHRHLDGLIQEDTAENWGWGSLIAAIKPGDGSAREQAASCQKVLGGWANIATEYATKRYRSNLINWGMLPLLMPSQETFLAANFEIGDWLMLMHIRKSLIDESNNITARLYCKAGQLKHTLVLEIGQLTPVERSVLLAGSLINYYHNTTTSDAGHC